LKEKISSQEQIQAQNNNQTTPEHKKAKIILSGRIFFQFLRVLLTQQVMVLTKPSRKNNLQSNKSLNFFLLEN
jgi:hypothetical protein